MANAIQFKRSSVSGLVPTAGSLLVGELAINLADARLFSKNGSSQVISITVDGSHVTTGTLNDGRLSSNVPLKNAANTFSANQTFSENLLLSTTKYVGLGSATHLVFPDANTARLFANGQHFSWDGASLYPGSNNARDIGSSANKWRHVYISQTFNQGGVTQNNNFGINSSYTQMLLGGDQNSDVLRTDATAKRGRFGVPHYLNAEEPSLMLWYENTASANTLSYGGGSSAWNTATSHVWYTAADNVTVTGTNRMSLSNSGLTVNGIITGNSTLNLSQQSAGATQLRLQDHTSTSRYEFSLNGSLLNLYSYASAANALSFAGLNATFGGSTVAPRTHTGNSTQVVSSSNFNAIAQINGTSAQGPALTISRAAADTVAPAIYGVHTRSTTVGDYAAGSGMTSGDGLLFFGGEGSDNTGNVKRGASIALNAGGTWSATSSPGYIDFNTTASGANTTTQRVRIDSDGSVLFGTTTNNSNGRLQLASSTSPTAGIAFGESTLYRATTNVLASNAALAIQRSSSFDMVFGTSVGGDTQNRFQIDAGGSFTWGPGNASRDTNLYRSAADTLRTDDHMQSSRSAVDNYGFSTVISGDTFARFVAKAGGNLEWGSGSTGPDTILRRINTGRLEFNGTSGTLSTFDVKTANAPVYLQIDGSAGYERSLVWRSGGSRRWAWTATATAESGSNQGSGLTLQAYNDSDGLIDAPITVVRAAGGVIALSRPLTGTTGSFSSTVSATGFTASSTGYTGTMYRGPLSSGTNVASADVSIVGALGTGTASAGGLVFQVGQPQGLSGSAQHSPYTVMRMGWDSGINTYHNLTVGGVTNATDGVITPRLYLQGGGDGDNSIVFTDSPGGDIDIDYLQIHGLGRGWASNRLFYNQYAVGLRTLAFLEDIPNLTKLNTIGALSTPDSLIALDSFGAPYSLSTADLQLQFRKGSDAERQTVTFADGEPVWTTDRKQIWVGDGTSVGGVKPRVDELTAFGTVLNTVQPYVRAYFNDDIGAHGLQFWDFSAAGYTGAYGPAISYDPAGVYNVSWLLTSDVTSAAGTSSFRFNIDYPSQDVVITAGGTGSSTFYLPANADQNRGSSLAHWDSSTTINTAGAQNPYVELVSPADNAIKAYVVYVAARRTGGTSGATNDAAFYELKGLFRKTAGTVALVGAVTKNVIAEDQAGWDVNLAVVSNTIRVTVTGVANNNISWDIQAMPVSR